MLFRRSPTLKTLEELRALINSSDNKILEIIKERSNYVTEVGHVKNVSNSLIYIPEREKQILERLKEKNREVSPVLPDSAIETIFTEIISACRNLEKPITISYLGPEASYTHIASIKRFGSSACFCPEKSIEDVFYKVEKGFSDYGVAPIENSTEGTINYTLDRLIESPLKIVAEISTPISHSLLSTSSDISKIKKIYSHPQSFAQCKNWVLENLKSVELIEVSSNSYAAKLASEEEGTAAIASKVAGTKYGLNILHEGIEDSSTNTTRFLVIGKNINQPSGHDKTSIVITPEKEQVGTLYSILAVFYKYNINLTMIESRPNKITQWRYIFFVDAEGHMNDEALIKAIADLKQIAPDTRILGSYPKD